MKKLLFLLCIITILTSSCSQTHIPTAKKLKSYLEDAGYSVIEHSSIGNVNDITRIIATKDESTLDVCYKVKDDNQGKIIDFYGNNYVTSYITGYINDFVYYASDKSVWEISRIDADIDLDLTK